MSSHPPGLPSPAPTRPAQLLTRNRELKPIGVWNWTLPAWAGRFPDGRTYNTCPSAGICREVCYARHGTYTWRTVRAKHLANLRFVLDDLPGWEQAMISELGKRKFHGTWVRVHNSGDFFTDVYLSAWLRIMRARPETNFYAYTKEVNRFRALVEPDPPDNFQWVYSFGGRQDSLLDGERDRIADVFPDEAAITSAGWHSQEGNDLLAVLGPRLVGIAANRIPHFLKKLGNRTFRSWQAEVDTERRVGRLRASTATTLLSGSVSPLPHYLRDPGGTTSQVLANTAHWLGSWWPVLTACLLVVASACCATARWWRRRCRRALAINARIITVLPPPTVDPAGAEALWANLLGLLRPAWRRVMTGQPHVAWEYAFDREAIRIRLWIPGTVPPGMVERAIEAAWPGARTRTASARSAAFQTAESVEAAGGELCLARSEALPIRTDFPADPIRALLGAPVDLGAHEQAVVQVLARPVTGHRVARARRAARRSRGRSGRPVSRLLDFLTPGYPHPSTRTRTSSTNRQTVMETSVEDRAIVAKQRSAPYETRVRYVVAATVPTDVGDEQLAVTRDRLRGRGHAIASSFATFTEHNYYRRARRRRPLLPLNQRRLGKGDLLSVRELAAVAHLPWDEAVPGLQRAGARAVPPPPGIATSGRSIRPIGLTDTGRPRPVGLRVADARQHVHILGATGSGKSELMARMILADTEDGRGVVVVDPKGDLITDLLMRLPEQLGPRVILFDAGSRSRPPVLNPLEGADSARVVDNLVSIFSRVYASSWGPRTDDILRAGLLTLRAQGGVPVLTDLPKLLAVSAFRQRAVSHISDDILRDFWAWYDSLSAPFRAQVTAPLMNKLRGVLLRPFVRAALAGGASTVDMDQVLDGGICLVRIAKDALGTETSRLMGSIVVARTWQAATSRARLPQTQRLDAGLYVDEAHNFLNLPYAMEDMLAEARGYRLSMTLAHQYLRQLPKELEEGISANARTKIFFNASPEDARHLVRHIEPRLTAHDLSNLDAFHAVVRPVLHGAEAPAFTVVTEPLPPAVPGRAKQIRAAAQRNARPQPSTVRKPSPGQPGDPRRP
ncbi:helicase HerA domain-containing protein [Streptomyces sp. NPDC057253]|uniref:GP88 family protein n=1 Tax=Streptomyces sp. NPDC057253 TaxID=3346069 RepID=UPI00362CA32D